MNRSMINVLGAVKKVWGVLNIKRETALLVEGCAPKMHTVVLRRNLWRLLQIQKKRLKRSNKKE